MCQTMCIPVCRDVDISGGLSRRTIIELFSFDAKQYSQTRRHLASVYADILESAGITPTTRLKKIAKSTEQEVVPA